MWYTLVLLCAIVGDTTVALASFVLVLRTLPRDAVSFFIFRSFRLVVLSLLFSSLLVVLAQLAALFKRAAS